MQKKLEKIILIDKTMGKHQINGTILKDLMTRIFAERSSNKNGQKQIKRNYEFGPLTDKNRRKPVEVSIQRLPDIQGQITENNMKPKTKMRNMIVQSQGLSILPDEERRIIKLVDIPALLENINTNNRRKHNETTNPQC